MALSQDLLDQAVRLLSHEKLRPKQASPRRSVSTAYYALFHLMTGEPASKMAPSAPGAIEIQMRRAFDHGSVKRMCRIFAGGSLPQALRHLQTGLIEPELRKVAKIFIVLQEARHTADYDLVHTFTKQEATDRVNEAQDAFSTWRTIKKSPNAALLLIVLALPKMLDREK